MTPEQEMDKAEIEVCEALAEFNNAFTDIRKAEIRLDIARAFYVDRSNHFCKLRVEFLKTKDKP